MQEDRLLKLESTTDGWRCLYLTRDNELTDSVAAEVRAWADFVPDRAEARLPDLALTFDGLVEAAQSGIIGGAVWSVFPAAARWLRRRAEANKPVDSGRALDIAAKCLRDAAPELANVLALSSLNQDDDRNWTVRLRAGGRTCKVVVDATANVVLVTISDPKPE